MNHEEHTWHSQLLGERFEQFLAKLDMIVFNSHALFETLDSFSSHIIQLVGSLNHCDYLTSLDTMYDSLSCAVEKLSSMYCDIDFEAIGAALETLADSVSNLVISTYSLSDESSRSISASISEAVPFMTQEQQQICEQDIVPLLGRKLSLSDMLALVSLLVTIFFSLIAQLPDEQLDVVIEQQQSQIAVERQENERLVKAIGSLTLSIGQLNNEIELLQEQLDDSTDLEIENNETTDNDGLNKTADTEQ